MAGSCRPRTRWSSRAAGSARRPARRPGRRRRGRRAAGRAHRRPRAPAGPGHARAAGQLRRHHRPGHGVRTARAGGLAARRARADRHPQRGHAGHRAGQPALAHPRRRRARPVAGADQARTFVADRVAEGSDYIKIIVGNPAPSHDQATLDALAVAAREHGRLSVAHAASRVAVDMAQRAKVSVLTHVPLDQALDKAAAADAVGAGRDPGGDAGHDGRHRAVAPDRDYAAARDGVTVMYQAGVPRSWPEPTPTPRPPGRSRSATAAACTTSSSCWSRPG